MLSLQALMFHLVFRAHASPEEGDSNTREGTGFSERARASKQREQVSFLNVATRKCGPDLGWIF